VFANVGAETGDVLLGDGLAVHKHASRQVHDVVQYDGVGRRSEIRSDYLLHVERQGKLAKDSG